METLKPAFILLLGMPGGSELILIVGVVLLIFGGKKIPELMRGIGKGMREFKDAKNYGKAETENDAREKDTKDNPQPPNAHTL